MKTEWKSILDQIVPKHVTLSKEKQQTILEQAEARLEQKKKPKRKWQPALVGVALAVIGCLFAVIFLNEQVIRQEKNADVMYEKAILPYEYPSLIDAQYDYSTHSLITLSSNRKKVLKYDLNMHFEEDLIKSTAVPIQDITFNEQWLVYATVSSIYVQNRNSNETYKLNQQFVGDLQISSNRISFLDASSDKVNFRMVNLDTKQITKIPIKLESSNSHSVLNDQYFITANKIKDQQAIYIYDIGNQEVKVFNVEADFVQRLSYANDSVFFIGDDVLQQMNLSTGKISPIQTNDFSDFGIYQNHIALTEGDTVKLYTLADSSLTDTHAFDNIPDRLVVPRFSPEGVLVVNAEDEDQSIYTLDVNANKIHYVGESKNWKATFEYTSSEQWGEGTGKIDYKNNDKSKLTVHYKGDLKELALSKKIHISYAVAGGGSSLNQELNESIVQREYTLTSASIGGLLIREEKVIPVTVKWGNQKEIIELKLKQK
ncbi:hypothetical protein [Viridibacillus arvi]|uniref:hypothetical protein n=1 Tax=Viridibacillus arvi TaxID=263475 RepID=UPI003D2A7C6A